MSLTTNVAVPPGAVSTVVLGIMQDAGLPHIGCRCHRCAAAYQHPELGQYGACLAIVDNRREPAGVWLIDATPDIRYQLNLLAGVLGPHPLIPDRLRQPDGLFLTHAHMGHTAGLAELGPEGAGVRGLSVYALPGLIGLLKRVSLWTPLLTQLNFVSLVAQQRLELAPDLSLTPIPVPHRDEVDGGTVAYRIQGPAASLLYLPDIDAWELWPDARRVLSGVDTALVDASFFSTDELGGRPPVAHPLVPETINFWEGLSTELILTHVNHTNPLLDVAGPELAHVLTVGAKVAHTGQIFNL